MKLKLYNRVFVLTWLHLEIDNLFTQTELPLYTERLKKMHLLGSFASFAAFAFFFFTRMMNNSIRPNF